METKLIVGNAKTSPAHTDSVKAIKTALRSALRWNQALLEGKARSLTELAAEENHDVRYLVDLVHLAYLAPDIQKAITNGKIPANLTLDKLKKRLPLSWSAQRQILGLS